MKTLSVIKKDMEFNKGLAALIEALKNIAVAQYRMLEQKIKTFEKFQHIVEGFFDFIDFSQGSHPFLSSQDRPQLVVAVTSDSGLLGGLNMQVVSAAADELEQHQGTMVVIGERGKMYAREFSVPFVGFPGIQDEERLSQALQMRDYLMKRIVGGEFGDLKVVYPRPVSFTVQRVETVTFLPFRHAPAQGQSLGRGVKDILLESSLDDCIGYLVTLWVGQRLSEIFGLSRLAEFAARYVHLEESLHKLKEMDTSTRLQYFRVRHEVIDRNMRELFSARLLYTH